MKLTKTQKQKIFDIISELTICAVLKNDRVFWDCNGLETKTSREENLSGEILRCNEEAIVNEILQVLAG